MRITFFDVDNQNLTKIIFDNTEREGLSNAVNESKQIKYSKCMKINCWWDIFINTGL